MLAADARPGGEGPEASPPPRPDPEASPPAEGAAAARKPEAAAEGKEAEEEEKEPQTADEWLASESEDSWETLSSFISLRVNAARTTVLCVLSAAEIDRPADATTPLFFVNLTLDGAEGGFRDSWNATPRPAGLYFRRAPSGGDVWLCEATHFGSPSDLTHAMRSEEAPTARLPGYTVSLPPLAEPPSGEVLVDLTPWLQSFSQYATGAFGLGRDADPTEAFSADPAEAFSADPTGALPADPAAALSAPGAGWAAMVRAADSALFAAPRAAHRCARCLPDAARRRRRRRPGGAAAPGGAGRLLSASAFPLNVVFRHCSQAPLGSALKDSASASQRTRYYSLCLARLPAVPMAARRADRRVGYFTTGVARGGPERAEGALHAIQRWNLVRRGGCVTFHIDRSVPAVFVEAVRSAVLSWNDAFLCCGWARGVRCLAHTDEDWPEDFGLGDVRFNPIVMTEAPVLGYGPSVCDFRSGEILHASVVLGLSATLDSAGGLEDALAAGGAPRAPPAASERALTNLRRTVVHEVGHCLGLRHNFLGAEDGGSSVMDYDEAWAADGTFAKHFVMRPGAYDRYAIRYGYTALSREDDALLDAMANGQRLPSAVADEDAAGPALRRAVAARAAELKAAAALSPRAELRAAAERLPLAPSVAAPAPAAPADPFLPSDLALPALRALLADLRAAAVASADRFAPPPPLSAPQNPLFATDECVGLGDPRVARWAPPGALEDLGASRVARALAVRGRLRAEAERGALSRGPPAGAGAAYGEELLRAVGDALRRVVACGEAVGGALVDRRRARAAPLGGRAALRYAGVVAEALVGRLLRLDERERELALLAGGGREHSYGLAPVSGLALHAAACRRLVHAALRVPRLSALEGAGGAVDTLRLLRALCFGAGAAGAEPLLHPFAEGGAAPSAAEVSAFGEDPLRAQARMEVAKAVNRLRALDDEHAAVAAGACAFCEVAAAALLGEEAAAAWAAEGGPVAPGHLPEALRRATPKARAAWVLFLQRLVRPKKDGGGGGMGLLAMLAGGRAGRL